MGLERIAAVMQGVHDNYDTDTFKALIAASEELTGTKAEGEQKASHRVIADHLRSTSFLLADGVLPSNEGRGYVLRRIMRRAMRHAHLLGAKEPLMHRLVASAGCGNGRGLSRTCRAQPLIEATLQRKKKPSSAARSTTGSSCSTRRPAGMGDRRPRCRAKPRSSSTTPSASL
jgi:alanyl-tRNA synthetase